jgi:hypothetical protein
MSSCSLDTGNFTDGRMAQINNYNIQYYRYFSSAFYRYSIILFVLIILLILRNSYIIEDYIFGILSIPILAYFFIDIIYTYYTFKKKGPLNFDTIVWRFNKNSAPSLNNDYITSSSTTSSSTSTTCVGEACCPSNMIFDTTNNICSFPTTP